MPFPSSGNRYRALRAFGGSHTSNMVGWTFARTGSLLVAASVLFTGQLTPQAPEQQSPNLNKPILVPETNRPPDTNDVAKIREQQNGISTFDAANIARKRQISDDSAALLKLATELKTAVDKTSKDTLSIGIIRKADEIEHLAHGVKEKMKVTAREN